MQSCKSKFKIIHFVTQRTFSSVLFLITSSINTDAILFTTEIVENLHKEDVYPNRHSELIRLHGSKKVRSLLYAV
jgi:hypothetical protein